MTQRLSVKKTYKLYLGGKFVRSESGRTLPAISPRGVPLDNYAWASRKDLRDAVTAARKAFSGWAGTTAYLKGQILYRAAEMLEGGAEELVLEIRRSTQCTPAVARREVTATIDRFVYFAGWTDKYQQVFGSVNPVATSHFNFSTPEPMGVVGVLAPGKPSLLGLVSVVLPAVLSGNTTVVLASERFPLPALTLAEILATSDLPGGVINLLAGKGEELVPHFASHMDINAIVDARGDAGARARLRAGTALNLKRYADRALAPSFWFGARAEDPYAILDTVETKTAWHPIGS
ncbi:MAG: aldehyde dehydrogenase family protein [Verrucomicrobia bacterium]|jgi:acyl-CoA reductase-like NAD-dependent aldehyde dehydrogenase|nr:aldehyde dehydrogenase family protein [Verrucomicrobiota bacterium]